MGTDDFTRMTCCFSMAKIRELAHKRVLFWNKKWDERTIENLAQGVESSDWLKLPVNNAEEKLIAEIDDWIIMFDEEDKLERGGSDE